MTFNNGKIIFDSGKEMLSEIQACSDLYNSVSEQYVFCYNNVGSIAVYNINNKEAGKLKQTIEELGGGWSEYLGPGGYIYDDPSYENYKEGDYNNLDWCNDNYKGEWEYTD